MLGKVGEGRGYDSATVIETPIPKPSTLLRGTGDCEYCQNATDTTCTLQVKYHAKGGEGKIPPHSPRKWKTPEGKNQYKTNSGGAGTRAQTQEPPTDSLTR